MSFILDALKKSESDRQRQSGPALFEVRVAPPRTRLPLWAFAVAALLVVNLGIVLWMLMHRGAHDEPVTTAAAAPAASVQSAPSAAPVPVPVAAPQSVQPTPQASAAPAATTQAQSAPIALPAPPAQTQAPSAPPAAASQTSGPSESQQNPADYAPAEESAGSTPLNHVRRGTVAGVPLYQDAALIPGSQLPPLRLDFHMYAPQAKDRFVMINMHKLHEGDATPEGVHVDSITPDGAILSVNGSRFLLPRD
jgi:general secretion pathway protein B